MPINDTLLTRWRLLLLRLNQIEMRARDEERVLRLHDLGYRIADEVPHRISLRPLVSAPPSIPESDHPCPECGGGLSLEEGLVACTCCLGVFHRGCSPAGDPCPGCRLPP